MSGYTFTPSEDADPTLVNAFQARLAKLKPACTRCGRVLTKKELATRQCAERGDCVLRQIFREVPRSACEGLTVRYGRVERKPLALAEVHKLRDFLTREPVTAHEGFPVLPPACVRCGKKLSPRELAVGRECSIRGACTKRMILSFRAPNFQAEIYASVWFDALNPVEAEEAIAA